jgi:hypothetical protein
MDELNNSFGQLSTSAAEWKPGGGGGAAKALSLASDSDLKAGAVKEFVPGKGWVTEPQSESSSGDISWL